MVTVAKSASGTDLQIVASLTGPMAQQLRELEGLVDRVGREGAKDVAGFDKAVEALNAEMRALQRVSQDSLAELRSIGQASSQSAAALDSMAGGAGKAREGIQAVSNASGGSFLEDGLGRVDRFVKGMGALAAASAFAAVSVKAFNDASAFDAGLGRIQGRLNLATDELEAVRLELLEIAKGRGFSAASAAEGFLVAVREGARSSGAALELLSAGVRVAGADIDKLEVSIDAVAKVLSGYGLGINQAARVSLLLGNLSRETGKGIAELANSLDNVIPAAKESGVALEGVFNAALLIGQRGGDLRQGFSDLLSVIKGGTAQTKEFQSELERAFGKPLDASLAVQEFQRVRSEAERTSAAVSRVGTILSETFGESLRRLASGGAVILESLTANVLGSGDDELRAQISVLEASFARAQELRREIEAEVERARGAGKSDPLGAARAIVGAPNLKGLSFEQTTFGNFQSGQAAKLIEEQILLLKARVGQSELAAKAAQEQSDAEQKLSEAMKQGAKDAAALVSEIAAQERSIAESQFSSVQRQQAQFEKLSSQFSERLEKLKQEGVAVDEAAAAYERLQAQVQSAIDAAGSADREKLLNDFRQLIDAANAAVDKDTAAVLKVQADARFELLEGIEREREAINRSIDAQLQQIDTLNAEVAAVNAARDALEALRRKRLEDVEARRLQRDEAVLEDFRNLIAGAQQADFASILAGDAETLRLRAILDYDAKQLQERLDKEKFEAAVQLKIDQETQARLESFTAGGREALKRLADDLQPFNAALRFTEGAVGSFASSFNDAWTGIVTGSKSAKDAWSDFARQFGLDVLGMINQLIALKAAQAFLGFIFGGPAPIGVSSGPSDPLGFGQSLSFAQGGVMPGKMLPLHSYAQGGIATRPQLALFGEGRGAEAFVPLPGPDRGIPVEFRNQPTAAADQVPPVNVSVTINMTGGSGDRDETRRALAAEARAIGDIVAGQISAGVNRGLVEAVRNVQRRR